MGCGPGARGALLTATLGACTAATGCANRTLAPPVPALATHRADLRGIDVHIRSFHINGAGTLDRIEAVNLQERLLDYLEARSILSDIFYTAAGPARGPSLILDIEIRVDQTTFRTYLLDAVALAPPIFAVFAPWWGWVDATVQVTVSGPDDVPFQTLTETARVDFSALFYAWFRRGYVEDAYTQAYEQTFDGIARQLASRAPVLRTAARLPERMERAGALARREDADAAASEPDLAATEPDVAASELDPAASGPDAAPPVLTPAALLLEPPLDAPPAAPESPTAPEAAPTSLGPQAPPFAAKLDPPGSIEYATDYGETPSGFGVIWDAPLAGGGEWTLWDYLRLLGGVEIAGIVGVANIASTLTNESGSVDVASGSAEQLGWRISLYDAPEATGLYWYPTVGFLSQRIGIADFREELPEVSVSEGRDIGGVCTDPSTGDPLDCAQSNVYRLDINSGYLGVRAGFHLVMGTEDVQLFVSAGAGVNVLELRSISATIGDYRGNAERWAALRSMAAGGDLGVRLRPLHVALRFIVDYEYYFKFGYADPLEFRGPTTFDPERNVYYRPRVLVDDAQLDTWSFQLATAFIF